MLAFMSALLLFVKTVNGPACRAAYVFSKSIS